MITIEEEWPKLLKLDMEKDLIGIYLSAHPLDTYKLEIEHFCSHSLADLDNLGTLNGQEVKLTPTEFEMLYQLAESAGTPLNQETLLRRVWAQNYVAQGNVVDVCIHRLRRKIEDDPTAPKRILTVRGAGYMLSTGQGSSQPRR